MEYRREHDLIGEKNIARDSYWGIHTARARENFTMSRLRPVPVFIRSFAMVKKAAALANKELGFLDGAKADAIIQACDEINAGNLSDQFPVDALQGGAGTSTNMNVNEVIANRALEIMGKTKGEYAFIHPLEQVNLHQSTNDVYPTATKIAAITQLKILSDTTARLQGVFQEKEKEWADVVKIGRTELEEAVPITFGAECGACGEAVSRDRWRTFKCEERLRVVNIGGTAVGTGMCAPRQYIFLVIEKLREITGFGLSRGENGLAETAHVDSFVEVSGILKAQASTLVKIADDIRRWHVLGEVALPAMQAGSSIMPGKINPVMCEAVMQVGMKVMANDMLIADAASRGSLQINEFMPLINFALLESLEILINATTVLTDFVACITVDRNGCSRRFDASEAIITAFVPSIGYDRATALVKEFHAKTGMTMRAFLEEKLGLDVVKKALEPQAVMALGYR